MTWANRSDLEIRLGKPKITQMATRRVFNSALNTDIDDSSEAVIGPVIEQALENSKSWITYQITCCFDSDYFFKTIDNGSIFPMIKEHHMRVAIEFLRWGGDCSECDDIKKTFADLCKCGDFLDQNNKKLKRKAKVSVSPRRSCIPDSFCVDCCEDLCKCKR